MMATPRHRGPDDEVFAILSHAGLGIRRLSVFLSGGFDSSLVAALTAVQSARLRLYEAFLLEAWMRLFMDGEGPPAAEAEACAR